MALRSTELFIVLLESYWICCWSGPGVL